MSFKIMRTEKYFLLIISLLLATENATAAPTWTYLPNICMLATLIANVAGALASLTIISAGLKWVTSGDAPGDRKQAKEMIIHAIVGLVIIFAARSFVLLYASYGFLACL
ncbi:TrbC/VIRB2 family protein [uncultured archaeon]|nr:TrbC/VIRB2 family protein [uncultured archaeon]